MLRSPRPRPTGAGRNLARILAALLVLVGLGMVLLGFAPIEERFDRRNAIGASGNAVERMEARTQITHGLMLVCGGLLAAILAGLHEVNATLRELRDGLPDRDASPPDVERHRPI